MMFERELLSEFKRWLEANGHIILEPIGEFEVLRWQGLPARPMPILHRRARTKNFTVNRAAMNQVKKFNKISAGAK